MKLLIVAPYFPPSAMPPSQRMRLMAPYFTALGVEATILTVKRECRDDLEDPWMLDLAGDDYKLVEIDAWDSKKARKFGIGDLGLRMLRPLYKELKRITKQEQFDCILFPVPPWYVMVVAPLIKKKRKIPYAIDFIDPWVEGGELPKEATWKRRLSQWIARKLEGWVTRNASAIFAVSQGIIDDLVKRVPQCGNIPSAAIAYATDPKDFELPIQQNTLDEVLVRYIGAVWDDAYPVLDGLFAGVADLQNVKFEFYGTSYAAGALVQPQLHRWTEPLNIQEMVEEHPHRIPYRQAVEFMLEADMLIIFGGMQPYYAASKLHGMIASGKPFFAMVHRDSYPAEILEQIGYEYVVLYSERNGDLPVDKKEEVAAVMTNLIANLNGFKGVDNNQPVVLENQARSMTGKFIDLINEAIC